MIITIRTISVVTYWIPKIRTYRTTTLDLHTHCAHTNIHVPCSSLPPSTMITTIFSVFDTSYHFVVQSTIMLCIISGIWGWKIGGTAQITSVKIGMERHSRDLVWRKKGDEFHPDCTNYRKWPSGTGMMFWGAFRLGSGLLFDCRKEGYQFRGVSGSGSLQANCIGRQCSAEREGLHSRPKRAWIGKHPQNSPILNHIENVLCVI
jgi:hypothetical protein